MSSDPWLLQSKLTPPSPPVDWLPRNFGALPSLTVLQGGPGDGKTLGLLSLVHAAAERGAPRVWLTLDAYDEDPGTLFRYLAAGMEAAIPQFGPEFRAVLANEELDARVRWLRFFQGIASYNLPEVLVVLDDVHHLAEAQPKTLEGLAYCLDKLPAGIRLGLATRRRLPVPLGKLETAGHARLLDQARLRFDPAEQEAYLARRAPGGVVPAAWRAQLASLDGWPAGIAALCAGATLAQGTLARYVAEELFGVQPPARQAFMLGAVMLQEPGVAACEAILQAPDAGAHLAALEADHLVQRLESGDGYRFPPYLAEFLLAEGQRTLEAPLRRERHGRAAAYYLARGQAELAIGHLVEAADWPGALAACKQAFPAMRFGGRQGQIARWLAAFPEAIAREEPFLALWRGHLRYREGKPDEAGSAYEQALAGYQARGDAAGAFKVLARQFGLALQRQDEARVGPLMRQTLPLVATGEPEDVADLHLARALAAVRHGDLGLAHECNMLALALPLPEAPEGSELAASHYIAHLNLFSLALNRGALQEARHQVAQALAIADRWAFYPYFLDASFMQAHLDLSAGEVEGMAALLRGLPPYWTELLDWHDLASALTVVGFYHQLKGEFEEAEQALRRSLALFREAGYAMGAKVPLERLMWLALARGDQAAVLAWGAEAGERGDVNLYDLALALPEARARHLLGEPAAALAALQALVPQLEGCDARLHLARARLFEAAARLALADRGGAERALEQALALVASEGYGFLLEQDQRLWEELAPLQAHETAPVAPTEPAPAAPAPVAEAAPQPPGRLQVRCFGGLEVRRDGVALDHWARRRAKLMFVALLFYPRGLRVIDMAQMFGSEEFSQAVSRTYQADLSFLRKALEPQLGGRESSAYLKSHDDRYMLDASLIERVDFVAFEQAIEAARALTGPDAARRYEEALELYRAPLLDDGTFLAYFEPQREHFKRLAAEALRWLAEHHRHDPARAEATMRRAIALEPTDEEAYLALMTHYQRQERPVMVRKTYFDCRKALKAELGEAPSDAFEQTYQALTRGLLTKS